MIGWLASEILLLSHQPLIRLVELLKLVGIEPTLQNIQDFARIQLSGRKDETEEEQKQDELARDRLQPLLLRLRATVSGFRDVLNGFGIDIAAVIHHGCVIIPYEEGTRQGNERTE